MGVEEHRKKLMAHGPTWGDRRSAHVAGGPRDNPDDNLQCNCEVEASTPIDLMNHVVNSPSSLNSRIYTCGWTFEDILKKGKRFREVPRVKFKEATKALIRFDRDALPLIIEGLHEESNWPQEDFHPDWLKNHGPKEISVRNVYDRTDKTMLFDKFIEQCRSASKFASPEEQERLYGKDADCPEEWAKWLRDSKVVPSPLIPDNVEDLLSSRHVETLMCYIGVGDTFTPCHKDLCASSGQNLMCYTEMDGSSFWFMTKGADAPEASKYFHELNKELDHETHVITIEQLADAPFDVFIAEQKLGDLVLVPPRSCHQVVNFGGITIKTSWSRMTLKGLEIAYYHELPIYRRVCRPEIYRVKSTIYQTLIKRRDILLSSTRNHKQSQAVLAPKTGDKKLISTTEDLLKLFDSVLLEEAPIPHRRLHCLQSMTSPTASPGSLVVSSTVIDQLTCDFCGADIFQSFFECLGCVNAPKDSNSSKGKHGDGFVICAGCYIEGRSCKCGNMAPIQCRPFQELLAVRNRVADLLSAYKRKPIPLLEDKAPTLATGIFRAACRLQEMRKNLEREERTCSTNVVGSSHVVPCSWVLNCKKCRRNRCFTHILMSQKLHAADALLIHASDSSHEEHHRHHGSSLQQYDEGKDRFFQTQRMGSKPDLTQQRVHLAEQYHTCKPINSAFIQAGWYDVHVQLVPMLIEAKNNSKDGSQDSPTSDPALPPLSPLTELDSPLPLLLDTPVPVKKTAVADVSPSLKRKRTVMDFVAVPNRKYKVKVSDRLALTLAGPEFSESQEIVPFMQVASHLDSDNLSTSSVANNMVCERDQEVMQTDPPRLPPTNRCNRASLHNPASIPQTPLISSHSKNSTPFLSQKTETNKLTIKKPQPLPSLIPPMSCSTPTVSRSTSSTSTRWPEPMNRFQTRNMTSTGEGKKNSRLDGPSSTPDQSSDLAKIVEESQPGLAVVRKLPRFKKNSRTMKRVLPEVSSYQSSSSSSTYPRTTPSDVPDLAQVYNVEVNEKHSALEALSANPPTTERTPSINNAAQTTPTDSAALDKAVKDLTDAARTITQLHQFTSHSSHYTVASPTPGWIQGNHLPMFKQYQPYLPSSTRKWSAPGYQQPSQYHDVHTCAAPPFEGGPNSRPAADYGRFLSENLLYLDSSSTFATSQHGLPVNVSSSSTFADGSNMRLGPAYSRRRHDPFREDRNRRFDNRSHPYRPWHNGAQARERQPRSAMRFDNAYRRPHSLNNRSLVSSYSRTNSGGGRGILEYPTEFTRAELAGAKSSTKTLPSQSANDEANNKTNNTVENPIGRSRPYEASSPRRLPLPQAPSSSLLESPMDRPWEGPSGPQVPQSDKADSLQELSSPHLMISSTTPAPAPAENGYSFERQGSPTRSENWEDNYVQEDPVIDKEVPRVELSKPLQQNEFPSHLTSTSLFDNPWAS